MVSPIIIDPLSATSLRVVPKFNDVELASATAFTVRWESQPYLITNWHVVTGRDPDTGECLDKKHAAIPKTLSVRFHAKGNLGAWRLVDLPLLDPEQGHLWLEHPMGKVIDVVAIPIAAVPDIHVHALDLALADVDIVPTPAMPVSVIGYPLGLAAGESWPIWKTGHIASDPDLDYEPGRPAFLIDATTRSGMSGAPVVLRLDSYRRRNGTQVLGGGMATKFMGVYAGRIHDASEIGRVWRPFVLSELFRRKLIFNDVTRRSVPGRVAACPCGRGRRFKECCGSAL
ncbi:trypsin-like peptidase domain-containing protein [Paucibacter sp. XJ19-41]|uniref:trypsin-like peptidase domain-containing protein n=1 Tax=Paucibacter sp. XJ19-41 TaxID=2927824 RepID=UPI00234AB48E|nr:trypsin-like peptidase domain-containing protein [Paucibacter sp. XJ19-41]MDC6170469.1 trypsin-like peptidase domain-containing protein [Paucibacter sp. XJ19-41]